MLSLRFNPDVRRFPVLNGSRLMRQASFAMIKNSSDFWSYMMFTHVEEENSQPRNELFVSMGQHGFCGLIL